MSSSDAKNTNTGNDIAPTIDPKDILRNLNTVVKELMREYNTQQEQKTAADANNDIVASGRLVQKLGRTERRAWKLLDEHYKNTIADKVKRKEVLDIHLQNIKHELDLEKQQDVIKNLQDENDTMLVEQYGGLTKETKMRAKMKELATQNKILLGDNIKLEASLSLYTDLSRHQYQYPKWTIPSPAAIDAGRAREIAVLMVSDDHGSEMVRPEHINNMGVYCKEVYAERVKRTYTGAVSKYNNPVIDIDTFGRRFGGIVLAFLGDHLSGIIHDLRRTNDMPVADAIKYAVEIHYAGIQMLKKHFYNVHIVGVPGNHGRLTEKIESKGYAGDNLDSIFFNTLEMRFDNDDHITFEPRGGKEVAINIAGHEFLFMHGDSGIKGGDGELGILAPAARTGKRSRAKIESEPMVNSLYDEIIAARDAGLRQVALNDYLRLPKKVDFTGFGHFHFSMYLPDEGVIANGSMVGYSEYGSQKMFRPTTPSQTLLVVNPYKKFVDYNLIEVADLKEDFYIYNNRPVSQAASAGQVVGWLEASNKDAERVMRARERLASRGK